MNATPTETGGYRQAAAHPVRTFTWQGKWLTAKQLLPVVALMAVSFTVLWLVNVHWTFRCPANEACTASSYSIVQWILDRPDEARVERDGTGLPEPSGKDKVGIPFFAGASRKVRALPANAVFSDTCTSGQLLFFDAWALLPALLSLLISRLRLTITTDGVTTSLRSEKSWAIRPKVTQLSFPAGDVIGARCRDDGPPATPSFTLTRGRTTREPSTCVSLQLRSGEEVELFNTERSNADDFQRLSDDLNAWLQESRA